MVQWLGLGAFTARSPGQGTKIPCKPCSRAKKKIRDFPGDAVVKNPPAKAGDMGSSPGLGRSHMPWSNYACVPQLLSLCYRAREPQLLSPRATTTEARTPRARALQQREATTMRSPCTTMKSSPRSCN